MSKLVDNKTYSIADFLKWHNDNELELSPKYQRNNVWNEHAKSYFLDSINRGMPIPPIFIRQKTDTSIAKVFKEVIDGQQRLRSIIDFFNGKISILPSHSKETKRIFYDNLTSDQKTSFLEYDMPVQIVRTDSDDKIYDMFARLNTNNYILNAQEIRNSRYWGEFKSLVYSLGAENKKLFIECNVFNDKQLSRMKDYELINHLLIFIMHGVSDGMNPTIEKYYREYDKSIPDIDICRNKFNSTINLCFGLLKESDANYFSRPPYFYTLFASVHEHTQNSNLNISDNIRRMEQYINDIEDNPQIKIEGKPIILEFIELHKRRTQNLSERRRRVEICKGFLLK